MIQISFQPALDPYHAVFRTLRILQRIGSSQPIIRGQLRILDFYMLFPFRISTIRLKPTHKKFKKIAEEFDNIRPYGGIPEDKIIFDRMEPMQIAALESLSIHGFVNAAEYANGIVRYSGKPIAEKLLARIEEKNFQENELMNFLDILARDYSLSGADGLKSRTNLMEYKYDAI